MTTQRDAIAKAVEALKRAASIERDVQVIERNEEWSGGSPTYGTPQKLKAIKDAAKACATALDALRALPNPTTSEDVEPVDRPASLAQHIRFIRNTTKGAAIVPHAWLDEWADEAERLSQPTTPPSSDLVEAGDAIRDKLEQLRIRQYQMMSQWAEASEEKKAELRQRLHESTDQYLDAI